MKFVAPKKGMTIIFFPYHLLRLLDPRSEIRVPGSGMGKNPGSATLEKNDFDLDPKFNAEQVLDPFC